MDRIGFHSAVPRNDYRGYWRKLLRNVKDADEAYNAKLCAETYKELYIKGLKALEDWFEAEVAAKDGCLFPCLIELNLSSCPKLRELPSLPSKLKSLETYKIGWMTLNFCSNSDYIPLEII
ncbi:hypothetical protein IEQ34_020556 [Dendrobium chrysotoxum]|uniref:Uncharacterized protein n=1 Tax=Dendrobium chrysotoxum TaxID=161865 RepID=A0AAV7FKM2_DENCH|nr:hypothetical protein IEQ34_020556 [Dendrobium chrysotoxum]